MLKKPYFSNYRVNALKTGSHRSGSSDRLDLSLLNLILQLQQDTNFFLIFIYFFLIMASYSVTLVLLYYEWSPNEKAKAYFDANADWSKVIFDLFNSKLHQKISPI